MSEQLVIEGYIEAFILIDGAIENSETFGFSEGRELENWIRQRKYAAYNDPRNTQLFLMQHDHSLMVADCACAQHGDHRTYWEFRPLEKMGD